MASGFGNSENTLDNSFLFEGCIGLMQLSPLVHTVSLPLLDIFKCGKLTGVCMHEHIHSETQTHMHEHTHTHTHARVRAHEHTGYAKLNLHSIKRAATCASRSLSFFSEDFQKEIVLE